MDNISIFGDGISVSSILQAQKYVLDTDKIRQSDNPLDTILELLSADIGVCYKEHINDNTFKYFKKLEED